MSAPENISLAFNDLAQGGSSDKVYHIALSFNQAGWKVEVQYGRRGSALASQTKCSASDYEQAKKVFDKLKREKMGKGYRIEGTACLISIGIAMLGTNWDAAIFFLLVLRFYSELEEKP